MPRTCPPRSRDGRPEKRTFGLFLPCSLTSGSSGASCQKAGRYRAFRSRVDTTGLPGLCRRHVLLTDANRPAFTASCRAAPRHSPGRAASMRICPVERIGHPPAGCPVRAMRRLSPFELRYQLGPHTPGEQRRPVLVALARAHEHQPLVEVDVLAACCRHVSSCLQVGQKTPEPPARVNHRSLGSLLFRQILQETSHPVAIGLLRSIGVVTGLDAPAELLHRPEWLNAVRPALSFRRDWLEPRQSAPGDLAAGRTPGESAEDDNQSWPFFLQVRSPPNS